MHHWFAWLLLKGAAKAPQTILHTLFCQSSQSKGLWFLCQFKSLRLPGWA